MSNKSENFLKPNLIKNLSTSKPSSATKTLYAGTASAQLSIQKPGSSYSIRSNHSRRFNERNVAFTPEIPKPIIHYHSWQIEYNQIYTREKIKKSMTKDSYMLRKYSIEHAIEYITTQEECCPKLISSDSIHIEKPIIHQITKPPLPSMTHYIRRNEVLPSEQPKPLASVKELSLPRLQTETKPSTPAININKTSGIAPALATTDRLLNRARMKIDASVIRRPPRRLILNTTRETIVPLTIHS